MSAPRGMFIALEGGDGAGKSTLAAHMRRALEDQGHTVVTTREPGGAPEAEEVRALLVSGARDRWDAVSELLLLTAARRAHVRRTIQPALDAGAIVICDRFVDSTRAYQGSGGGVAPEFIDALHADAVGLSPDLTLILDIPPAEGLKRAQTGREGRFESFDLAFHERVREAYLALAQADPDHRRVINAAAPAPMVAEAAMISVNAALAARAAAAAV